MSREILITTPENIAIEYEVAGLGTRFAAYLIDLLLIGVILLVMLIVLWVIYLIANAVGVAGLSALTHYIEAFLSVILSLVLFVVFWGYGIYFESAWNGQTPGKRAMGLRAIREGGYPISLYAVFLRNLLRFIAYIPVLNTADFICILLSPAYQRIGDYVGGTIVVKQRAPQSLEGLLRIAHITPDHLDKDALLHIQRQADMLTPEEYRAVRHFTERRRQLLFNAQQSSAIKIAVPLMKRLNIVPPPGATMVNYADFLEYLAVAYEQLRRPK